MKKKLILLLSLIYSLSLSAQIKYVTPNGSGSKDGSSWGNAKDSSSLKSLLDASSSGDTIWVAAGTYWPTDGTSRNEYFEIKDGVKVFGGFAGYELVGYNLALRDFSTNQTILSGDIGNPGVASDNSYHVVYTQNVSATTVLDGFTIQDGNANNNTFPEERGGGWFNTGRYVSNNSSPTINNCIFKNNYALNKGGALCNDGYEGNASPILSNCSFINNSSETSTSGKGGAIYNEGLAGNSNPSFTNCLFYNNTAYQGGGVFNDGNAQSQDGHSNPTFLNCTFYNNGRTNNNSGEAIFSESADNGSKVGESITNFKNTILWGENTFYKSFSIVGSSKAELYSSLVREIDCAALNTDGVATFHGSGNLFAQNPIFVDSTNGNLRLQNISPAVNMGDNSLVNWKSDIIEKLRIRGGTVDMGAFENQNSTTLMYVDQDQTTGNNNGSSWANAFTNLQDALTLAIPNDSIWVAAGTYKPTTGTDRTISFHIPDSVKIYGGLEGNEAINYNLANRNYTSNETILSGNIGLSDSTSDNSLNIVLLENVSEQTVIDGFTITEAYDNSYQIRSGGLTIVAEGLGTASKPIVTNCHITKNETDIGAGITILGYAHAEASPAISHCVLDSNKATLIGGGLYAKAFENGISHLSISNSTFNDNNANDRGAGLFLSSRLASTSSFNLSNSFIQGNKAGSFGGGVYISAYDAKFNPVFRNCVITGNYAYSKGAAIFLDATKSYEDDPEAKLELINCTIAINAADPLATNSSSGIDISVGEGVDAQPTITNTIIYENGTSANDNFKISYGQSPSITYSYITGLTVAGTADSNISYQNNPYIEFVDESITAPSSKGNFAITGCEATWGANTFNKGDNTAAGSFDIRNKARIFNSRVDLGAYEYDGEGLLSHDDIEYFDSFEKLQVNSVQHAPKDSHLSATKSIELLPGFEAEQGAIFKAEINSEMCIP